MIAVLLIVAIVLINESVFIVGEAEQSVVSRFGVIKRIVINKSNDFHEQYADLLKDEITSTEDVKISMGSGLHFKGALRGQGGNLLLALYTYVSDSEWSTPPKRSSTTCRPSRSGPSPIRHCSA